jgi:hypothetical protein
MAEIIVEELLFCINWLQGLQGSRGSVILAMVGEFR